jgi:hypothetical protein
MRANFAASAHIIMALDYWHSPLPPTTVSLGRADHRRHRRAVRPRRASQGQTTMRAFIIASLLLCLPAEAKTSQLNVLLTCEHIWWRTDKIKDMAKDNEVHDQTSATIDFESKLVTISLSNYRITSLTDGMVQFALRENPVHTGWISRVSGEGFIAHPEHPGEALRRKPAKAMF